MATIDDGRSAEATMVAMLQRLGIDLGACVHPRTDFWLACARRNCRACEAKEECRAALTAAPPAPVIFARFCPNAEILQDLLHETAWERTPAAPPR
jgi:hypothetical protein